MKFKLKKFQLFEKKEIYQISPNIIKNVIDECYCENVDIKKNKELYENISQLLGLYSYIKDKKNIKPFIIIGRDII